MSVAYALVTLLLCPAEVVHELTHAAFARRHAAAVGFEWTGTASRTRIEWRSDAPVLWVRLTHLAPTLVGVVLGVVSIPLLPLLDHACQVLGRAVATTMGVPSAAPELSLLVALALVVNWIVYVFPSGDDLRPFNSAQ